MTEDWAAVARAINERMTELGLSQLDLVKRSHVSKTMIMEIRRNSVQRRRSTRMMEALSEGLEWHPGHLHAVLQGLRTPNAGEPLVRREEDTSARLAAIEHRLSHMQEKFDELTDVIKRLDAIITEERGSGDGRPWTP